MQSHSDASRESIWSVTEGERRWYFALFPTVLICSVSYYANFVIDWTQSVHQGVGILMLAFGALGVSSAIFTMVLVAGGSFMVISMGWLRDKVDEQRAARKAVREAERQKWIAEGVEKGIAEGRRLEREEQRKREERMNGVKDE